MCAVPEDVCLIPHYFLYTIAFIFHRSLHGRGTLAKIKLYSITSQ